MATCSKTLLFLSVQKVAAGSVLSFWGSTLIIFYPRNVSWPRTSVNRVCFFWAKTALAKKNASFHYIFCKPYLNWLLQLSLLSSLGDTLTACLSEKKISYLSRAGGFTCERAVCHLPTASKCCLAIQIPAPVCFKYAQLGCMCASCLKELLETSRGKTPSTIVACWFL